MRRFAVKLAPNSDPNAEGGWVSYWAETAPELGFLEIKPDHHVVRVRSDDPQDGGPMHAHFLRSSRAREMAALAASFH